MPMKVGIRFIIIVCISLILGSLSLFSQIQITKNDMANPGEIFTVNITNQPFGIDITQTGPNQIWNFSQLINLTERNDTFISPWQAPPEYWLFFNGFNTTTVQKIPNSFSVSPYMTVSDIYNFYYTPNARHELTGFGALINNIPTPIKYDTNDVIYRFPLQYQQKDTSFSTFDVNIPNIGYWKNNQIRYNHVDGWGTVYIPNDTFEVLRIRSEIHNSDSIHLDTLGGFSGRFNRPIQVEYKFLTNGVGIPVLKINTQKNFLGQENITSIEYLKIEPSTSSASPHNQNANILLFPEPKENKLTLLLESPFLSPATLKLFDIHGKIHYQISLSPNQPITLTNLPEGIFFLYLQNGHYAIAKKLIFAR